MSELGELFSLLREENKNKRLINKNSTLALLDERKISYKRLSDTHFLIENYNFWPSTGLYIHRKTKKRGRGIFNLLKEEK